MSKEQLLSCSNLCYRCYYRSKKFLDIKTYTIVKTNINDDSSIQNKGISTFFALGYFGFEGISIFFPMGNFSLEGISTFCPHGVFLGMGVLAHFELYQVFMC